MKHLLLLSILAVSGCVPDHKDPWQRAESIRIEYNDGTLFETNLTDSVCWQWGTYLAVSNHGTITYINSLNSKTVKFSLSEQSATVPR